MQIKHYVFAPACLLVLLSVLTMLSACDLQSLLQNPPAPPRPPEERPMSPEHQPYSMVEIWLDATNAYPKEEFARAKQKIAQAIDDAVQVNSDGMDITIGLLRGNAFDPSATVMTITIPKIEADPAAPALKPMPTPMSDDQFAHAKIVRPVQMQNNALQNQYQEELRKNHEYLAQVRKQVRAQTDKMRSLETATAATKDLWGAAGRSARRFQGVQAKKHLILATDLEGITHEQFTPNIFIPHVTVSVIHYCSDQPRCEETSSFWKSAFINAGATSYNDVQSQKLSLFS